MAKYKYVNASNQVVYVSSNGGGRIALAPGQSLSDSYYERFSRAPHEKPSANKVLLKVAIGGNPTTTPFSPDTNKKVTPKPLPKIKLRSQVAVKGTRPATPHHMIGGACITACETACMTVAEFGIAVDPKHPSSTIKMPNKFEDVPPAPPVAVTKSEDLVKKEEKEEKTVRVIGKVTAEPVEEAAPKPEEPAKPKVYSTAELMEKYGFTKDDVSQDRDYFVFTVIDGKLKYYSKLDMNFVCTKRSAMLAHVKAITGG